MILRVRTLTLAAAGAAALPLLVAALTSGSCSLAELYSGGGGAAGGAAVDAGRDAPGCPDGMVGVPTDTPDFCIDRVEVTNLDYARFLAAQDGGVPLQPERCAAWKKNLDPLIATDAGDALPVLGIDWCDAHAYCAWAGKHLCGLVDGGALAPDELDVESDAWFVACSRYDQLSFPYAPGTTDFDQGACNTCDPDAGCDAAAARPLDVGSKPGCEGGYPGIFDMSGNAWEWQDACLTDGVKPDASVDGQPVPDSRYDTCYRRGGSFTSAQACARCKAAKCGGAAWHRWSRAREIGARCCFNP